MLSVDVLDRHVDENGVLKTTRLVLKKGKVPKWFPQSVRTNYFSFYIMYIFLNRKYYLSLLKIQRLLLLKNLKLILKQKP